MCMMSVILDHYDDKFRKTRWYPEPYTNPPPISPFTPNITRTEFDELRKEVLELKELAKKAKEYDERTHQPDCEKPELVAILGKIAKAVGVDLNDVLSSSSTPVPEASKAPMES